MVILTNHSLLAEETGKSDTKAALKFPPTINSTEVIPKEIHVTT
jgi:hypothetical protein